MAGCKLIALDFTEHDTIEAADMLRDLARSGKITGMVFALQMTTRSSTRKVMLGATGRPANDVVVATALASILHCNLTQQAMREAHHDE